MPWCSHHPTFTSVMVYSTELRRRVVQSVGVTAAVSACCMMHLGDVEVTESALSAVCALGALSAVCALVQLLFRNNRSWCSHTHTEMQPLFSGRPDIACLDQR